VRQRKAACGCYSHNSFLTKRGYELVAQRELEFSVGVDTEEPFRYLDRVGSVSGSLSPRLHWDDAVIEEQYRRFHNGS